MRRRAFLGLGAGWLAGLLRPASAQGEDPVKVGLTETFFPELTGERLQKAAAPFRSLFESATGVRGKVYAGGDAEDLAAKLKKDELQLGVFQGIEFARARSANPKLEPIVLCVNQSKTLRAYLLVAGNSAFRKPADLRGRTLTVPKEIREHCRVFLRQGCLPEGEKASAYFRKVLRPADTEEALDSVIDGDAQAALVDGLAWASYRESKPGAAKRLRVLLGSEPFPCTVLACQAGRFGAAQLGRIREGLIGAKDRRARDLLQQLRLTGFEAVPADYERQLTAVLKAYPPPSR